MSIAWLSGLIILVILVIMLIAGAPIAISLAVSSICAILPVLSTEPALITGAQRIFSGISVFNLIAIPFFILAGNIMNRGGIAIKLINFAKIFTGRIPGSLAHTNVVANMLFGAISGSGTAAASAMGAIIGPVEEKEGYDKNFSAAVNIATAPTGLLIPPSNVMITFAMVSGGTSIAALFMAGYIPGILWGIACMVVIYLYAKKRGYTSNKHYALKEKTKIIIEALPCLLMIVIVIGGIIGGIFTATEGAIVAVVYSLILSLVFYKSIKISELPKLLVDSAEMTGIIIFLIGVSSIMSWGNGFYWYTSGYIRSNAWYQQQQICYFTYNKCYSSYRWNIYGYDASLPYIHTNISSDMSGYWYEYNSFWHNDDIQFMYRNNYSASWNNAFCGC